jgi:farnesyl diphosphate synthase
VNETPFSERLATLRERVERALDSCLPPASQYPSPLHEAMRYAATGGKRLRALLVHAGGEVLSVPPDRLDAAATAVELIHAYSLVHDDLPAMDDDDLRRGRPTVHKQFDEATAILVGDALQTLAFHALAADCQSGLSAEQRLHMIETLAEASGSRGMVGGQAIDLRAQGQDLSLPELEVLHIHKTGALIRACLLLACHANGKLDGAAHDALDRYGKCVGLAYQIQDDIFDVEGSAESLGKTPGKDHAARKTTYVSLLGLGKARRRADELFEEAAQVLSIFGARGEPLLTLSAFIRNRAH